MVGQVGSTDPTGVLITIDVEIAPHTSDWKREGGRFALSRDVYGLTANGERGLRYYLDVFDRFGLKCVVFVEALCAGVLGGEVLREIVGLIEDRGQEVALHLHPEWLAFYDRPFLAGPPNRFMHDFCEGDQRRLIESGLENLARAGADGIVAMRAGNAGADAATLRAARTCGLTIDSSHFAPAIPTICKLPGTAFSQPYLAEGVLEVPISWFQDGLGRVRPVQLCACSSGELEHVLGQSRRARHAVVTVLTHSFELVRRRPPEREQTVVRMHEGRLLRLCRFLAAHRDEFASLTCRDLLALDFEDRSPSAALSSPLPHTLRRYFEQAVGRLW